MSGSAVYVFMMLRGFLGSLNSKPARRILLESMSLHCFLQCRELINTGAKAADALTGELSRLEIGLEMRSQAPSRREMLKRVLEQIRSDIADAKRVIEYCGKRVLGHWTGRKALGTRSLALGALYGLPPKTQNSKNLLPKGLFE